MADQQTLFKGEFMEELLRNYFINSGYYVVRGIKYKYEGLDVTDVDLYLYGRSSSLTRQQINVDIKNKKTPQVFERILWANGLMKLLKFDSCIVATTDQRPIIHTFGRLHNTIIMDGAFLSKLRSTILPERLSEEELLSKLSKCKSYDNNINKDWRNLYEASKSRLISELDFSGFNSSLTSLIHFIEKYLTDEQKREESLRMIYLVLSHMLVIIDFLLKDISFLDNKDREKRLSDGFKFGNLGKDGVDKIIGMAIQIAGNKSANAFLKSFENIPTNILQDFFAKNENAKNVFVWARDFENLGYRSMIIQPNEIEPNLKGVLSVILDFAKIDRKRFFPLTSNVQVKVESESQSSKNDIEIN